MVIWQRCTTATAIDWYRRLYLDGYISTRDITYCPSLPPTDLLWWSHQAYGQRSDSALSNIRLTHVDNPSGYIFYADSINHSVTSRKQSYGIYLPGCAGDPTINVIHRRHSGMANCWFADGHVKACGSDELQSLGWVSAE